jgi:beta-lactamase class A
VQELAHLQQRKSDSLMRKLITLFIFGTASGVILISAGFLLLNSKDAKTLSIISPLAAPIQETYASIKESLTPDLGDTVIDALRGADGEYGIVIKNLKTGETYQQNADESFTSASLYKLWLMGTAYTQFENGTLRRDMHMSQDAGTLNTIFHIGSDSAALSGGNVAMSSTEAIYKAITVSDNYAALLLTNRVTIKEMKTFLTNNGMIHTTEDILPHTTPSDIGMLYEKLYNQTLVSSSASAEMVQILKEQKINDRIPKYLPAYVQIAHKTGELDGYKHDAGIIYTPKGDYIFVAMSNTSDPAIAAERIAVLSQRVYAYFAEK